MNAFSSFQVVSAALVLLTASALHAGPGAPPASDSSGSTADLLVSVQAIANEPDGILRYQRTDDLVATLPEKDYPIVLNLMLLPGTETPGLIDLAAKVFRRWTEVALDQAVAWVGHVPDGTVFGREAYGLAGAAKARANASDALAWLSRVPKGANRAAAQFAVAGAIARQDPRTALNLALRLPVGASRDGLLAYCVANWSVTDFNAAANWIRGQPEEPMRDMLAARLATQEAVKDAPRAAEFVMAALPAGDARNRSLSQVLRFWAAASPADAAGWALRLPDGDGKRIAVDTVAETWARKDRSAAKAWVSSLRGAPSHDMAARALRRIAPRQ